MSDSMRTDPGGCKGKNGSILLIPSASYTPGTCSKTPATKPKFERLYPSYSVAGTHDKGIEAKQQRTNQL